MRSARRILMGMPSLDVPKGLHVCYLFDDEDERLHLIARFFEAGWRAREKLLYVVDTMTPREMRIRLGHLEKELGSYDDCVIMGSNDAYFPEGKFSDEAMRHMVRSFYDEAV